MAAFQDEVERIVFRLIRLDARADQQVVDRLAGQPAVVRETAHAVIHIVIRRAVGEAARDERLDHADDLVHVARGARFLVGPQHAELVRVLVHGGDEAAGERIDGFLVFIRALDDLVVDVGNVADVRDRQSARAQVAHHHVEHHQHARMPEVAVVVHGHAAHVHAHLAGLDRRERFLFPAQGVVDMQHSVRVKGKG